jgi:crotonobetainyl-CoA:carnitine CoA-transferase CaiB-like acyl-CoA transferase
MALQPQFLSNAQRCRNRPALIQAIQAITLTAPGAQRHRATNRSWSNGANASG